jgi:hypothetical protein
VSGRDDLVSPTLVTRNFVEGFVTTLNDRILSEHSLDNGRVARGLNYDETTSYGNGASANSAQAFGGIECPFIEPAEGWSVEYYENNCKICGAESLCMCRKDLMSTEFKLRPLEEASYREHFFNTEHWNYFTDEPDIGPIVLSLKQELCGEKFR